MWYDVGWIQIMDHNGQPQEPRDWCFIYDITIFFISIFNKFILKNPYRIIYVLVVNIKKSTLTRSSEKALDFKKSWVLGRASKMNTENTYIAHIYLHHLTTALTKAPYLDFQRAYIPPTSVSIIPARSECCIGLQERQRER